MSDTAALTGAASFLGRTISGAELNDDALILTFADGGAIKVFDGGQCCCESRYMRTDDDISTLVGRRLARIDGKPGPGENTDYDEHETYFVEVGTDVGFVTLTNHNEHNGYYGGFYLCVEAL